MQGKLPFTTVLVIPLLCLSLLVMPASAGFNGYIVEPVTPGTDRGAPLEITEVSFWDLPPQIMVLCLAVSLPPVIAFPVELLAFTKLFLWFGYRKIARHNIFDHEVRNRIYTCIQENPGIRFMAISRETNIVPGTLHHHIAILKLAGKITLLETCGHTRYFENSGKYPEIEQKVLKYLQMPAERIIFDLIIKNPDVCRKELEQQLGLSGSSVTWHMNRLSDDGLIMVDKAGKSSRYVIDPEVVRCVKKYMEGEGKEKTCYTNN